MKKKNIRLKYRFQYKVYFDTDKVFVRRYGKNILIYSYHLMPLNSINAEKVGLVEPRNMNPKIKDMELDPLYDSVKRIVNGCTSTSFVQRTLNIGYSRAANIIDQLKAKGDFPTPHLAVKRGKKKHQIQLLVKHHI